jgi:hypothetical protein
MGNLKGDSPSVASMARSIPATWYVGGGCGILLYRMVSYIHTYYGILYTYLLEHQALDKVDMTPLFPSNTSTNHTYIHILIRTPS